eukprot:CAMPEP_0202394398 /NCGR_PEP_ID=MMETSP1127-20130417/93409_1 /ASSEMBLY_ACC=CAM_ASM_000462 /TAXON_ID=3047 /ORGANISM="Dunaliella tertiolecta, Strain CCMP1320" /LENGTH=1736 /DNA_ID=CAMNT_0048997019 /DNA_START=143 /DNA_END=5353 /DNA_ORIENTATION=-
MGACQSSHLLQKDPDWRQYVDQEWKSQRAKVLDRALGLGRSEPISLGSSFTRITEHLGDSLAAHGDTFAAMFAASPIPPSAKKDLQQKISQQLDALEKAKIPQQQQQQQQQHLALAHLWPPRLSTLPSPPQGQPPSARPAIFASSRALTQSKHPSFKPINKLSKDTSSVPEWRLRVHHARRRVLLLIRTAQLLQRGWRKSHTSRLPRLENMSDRIPGVLGADLLKFTKEMSACLQQQQQVEELLADLEGILLEAGQLQPDQAYYREKLKAAQISAQGAEAPMQDRMHLGSFNPHQAHAPKHRHSETSVPIPKKAGEKDFKLAAGGARRDAGWDSSPAHVVKALKPEPSKTGPVGPSKWKGTIMADRTPRTSLSGSIPVHRAPLVTDRRESGGGMGTKTGSKGEFRRSSSAVAETNPASKGGQKVWQREFRQLGAVSRTGFSPIITHRPGPLGHNGSVGDQHATHSAPLPNPLNPESQQGQQVYSVAASCPPAQRSKTSDPPGTAPSLSASQVSVPGDELEGLPTVFTIQGLATPPSCSSPTRESSSSSSSSRVLHPSSPGMRRSCPGSATHTMRSSCPGTMLLGSRAPSAKPLASGSSLGGGSHSKRSSSPGTVFLGSRPSSAKPLASRSSLSGDSLSKRSATPGPAARGRRPSSAKPVDGSAFQGASSSQARRSSSTGRPNSASPSRSMLSSARPQHQNSTQAAEGSHGFPGTFGMPRSSAPAFLGGVGVAAATGRRQTSSGAAPSLLDGLESRQFQAQFKAHTPAAVDASEVSDVHVSPSFNPSSRTAWPSGTDSAAQTVDGHLHKSASSGGGAPGAPGPWPPQDSPSSASGQTPRLPTLSGMESNRGLAWDSSGDLSGSISASDVGSALEQRISEVVGGLPEGGFLNKKQRVHKVISSVLSGEHRQWLAQEASTHVRHAVQEKEEALKKAVEKLEHMKDMLQIYASRGNGSWAETQEWLLPKVAEAAKPFPLSPSQKSGSSSVQRYVPYSAEIVSSLITGQVAVQLICSEEGTWSIDDEVVEEDLWTVDLWALLGSRLGALPEDQLRIQGVPRYRRVLHSLVQAVRDMTGSATAAQRLFVVMHVHEHQLQALVDDLMVHKCFGLNRERVLLMVAQRQKGYCLDSASGLFLPPDAGAANANSPSGNGAHAPRGAGYCMAQLAWAGEALMIGASGKLERLPEAALELMSASGVQWLVSRCAQDLRLSAVDGILDAPTLAQGFHLSKMHNVGAVMEVSQVRPAVGRPFDSEVFGTVPTLDHLVVEGDFQAELVRHLSESRPRAEGFLVTELQSSQINSPNVKKALRAVRMQGNPDRMTIALGRYMFSVPALASCLKAAHFTRPTIQLSAEIGCITMHLHMSDILMPTCLGCVAMQSRHAIDAIVPRVRLPVMAMVQLLHAQDSDPLFRRSVPDILCQNIPRGEGSLGQPRFFITFVPYGKFTPRSVVLAAQLARPSRDAVYVIMCVPTRFEEGKAQQELQAYPAHIIRKTDFKVEIQTSVLVHQGQGLLNCMEEHVKGMATAHPRSSMCVLMDSLKVTSPDASFLTGSVSLAATRRFHMLGIPVIISTANNIIQDENAMYEDYRFAAVLAEGCGPMVHFLASNIMDSVGRTDRLLFVQEEVDHHVLAGKSLRVAEDRKAALSLEAHQAADRCGQAVLRDLEMPGNLEKMVNAVAYRGFAHLAAVPVLQARSLPTPVLQLLQKTRLPVLLYPVPPSAVPVDAAGQSREQGEGMEGDQ